MNIKIEGCSDVGMTENHTYCLIVALAFDASGGECVAQTMKDDLRNSQPSKQTAECFSIGARLIGFGSVAHHIVTAGLLAFH